MMRGASAPGLFVVQCFSGCDRSRARGPLHLQRPLPLALRLVASTSGCYRYCRSRYPAVAAAAPESLCNNWNRVRSYLRVVAECALVLVAGARELSLARLSSPPLCGAMGKKGASSSSDLFGNVAAYGIFKMRCSPRVAKASGAPPPLALEQEDAPAPVAPFAPCLFL